MTSGAFLPNSGNQTLTISHVPVVDNLHPLQNSPSQSRIWIFPSFMASPISVKPRSKVLTPPGLRSDSTHPARLILHPNSGATNQELQQRPLYPRLGRQFCTWIHAGLVPALLTFGPEVVSGSGQSVESTFDPFQNIALTQVSDRFVPGISSSLEPSSVDNKTLKSSDYRTLFLCPGLTRTPPICRTMADR